MADTWKIERRVEKSKISVFYDFMVFKNGTSQLELSVFRLKNAHL